MDKVIVFDIDGTLADIEHRRHYVQSKPKNWGAFNRGMKDDKPNEDIIFIADALWHMGCDILIASGRGDEERTVTATWLAEHRIVPNSETFQQLYSKGSDIRFFYEKLYMRKAGDYRTDDIVKREILDQMREDGYEPYMIFDDRDQVVNMWRANGIRCLQVAPGNF